jgi:FKBP-type peptidyl-prolyl cis-trans isomerase 2
MIQNGTIVNVHYTGKLTDGSVFDTSEGNGTLRFEVGSGQIIPGFEKALIGKNIGDKVTISINPEEAYGPVYEDLLVRVPKDRMPEGVHVGQTLQASNEGSISNVVVVEVNEGDVVIDGNHPLAGKELIFDIEVVSLD